MQNNINNNENDFLRDIFKEKLENQTMPVDEKCWAEIEMRLQQKEKRKRVIPFWWWTTGGAAAAIILLLILVRPFSNNQFEPIAETIQKETSIVVANKTVKNENKFIKKNHKVFAADIVLSKKKSVQNSIDLNKKTESKNTESTEKIQNSKQEAVITDNGNDIIGNETEQKQTINEAKTESVIPVEKKSLKKSKPLEEKQPEWEDPKKKNSEKDWGIIASVGASGGASASNSNISSGNYSMKRSIIKASTVTTVLAPADFRTREYLPPINFSIGVARGISKTWSVESGINYSFLMTNFTDDNYDAASKLHYIGIPLKINKAIFRSNKWGVYGSAGAMIEKGIYSDFTQRQHVGEQIIITTAGNKIDGIQWSLNAAAGISYTVFKNTELYVQPDFSYFFENNQPVSIRSDKKLVVEFRGGLRFNF
ncbi:MAG: hypothetical protein PHH37_06045 [Paludibacter sp.]|nr:hypothetical protein [Paludibacter sp.]